MPLNGSYARQSVGALVERYPGFPRSGERSYNFPLQVNSIWTDHAAVNMLAPGAVVVDLWVSPDGEGRSWSSRTLIGELGKGYASAVELSPGLILFCGYSKKERALQVWRVKVERVEPE